VLAGLDSYSQVQMAFILLKRMQFLPDSMTLCFQRLSVFNFCPLRSGSLTCFGITDPFLNLHNFSCTLMMMLSKNAGIGLFIVSLKYNCRFLNKE
jgi:hypothetical protein